MRDEVESLRQMIIEVAAESIDELLEKYFADEELTIEEIYEGLNVGVKERKIAPLFTGAANYGLGIMLLMNSIKISFLLQLNVNRSLNVQTLIRVKRL